MAKYKAQASSKEVPNEENYCAYGSASSHQRLMAGETIEKDVPAKLLEHLTEVGGSRPSKQKPVKEVK